MWAEYLHICNISLSREQKRLMRKAMDYVTEKVPCVTFTPKTETTLNYVAIHPGPGCESEVGMKGLQQYMHLNATCFAPEHGLLKLVHELLHTLGFVHEQNRPDRDTFVTVNLDHSGLNSAENEIVEVVLAESVTTALIN